MMSNPSILSNIAVGMSNFGSPVLLDERHWEEAARMADAGLLQRHEPIFNTHGYTLTDAGMAAYREAFPAQPVVPAVKAWGQTPPQGTENRIAFIKKLGCKELERAYWLEVDGQESMTLSSTALDAKLKELGYNRFEGNDAINFGAENSSEAMPTCAVTGELLEGSWSADPYGMSYGLEGFSWRRSEGFQMEERDWCEANGYIERLDADDQEQKRLIELIVDSCFLDPIKLNDTGLICPGGGCYSSYEQLIELFDFMQPQDDRESGPHQPMRG